MSDVGADRRVACRIGPESVDEIVFLSRARAERQAFTWSNRNCSENSLRDSRRRCFSSICRVEKTNVLGRQVSMLTVNRADRGGNCRSLKRSELRKRSAAREKRRFYESLFSSIVCGKNCERRWKSMGQCCRWTRRDSDRFSNVFSSVDERIAED